MKNQISTYNNSSFFESVAHHNLERFHSETIAWIFNTFPITAKNFIKSVHTDIQPNEEIKFEKGDCSAELNQIDILLKYRYKEKNYQIIIENKMKASEHKIDAEKLKGKNFDNYKQHFIQDEQDEIEFLSKGTDGKVMLSQTEYYYLREKMERLEQIVDFELDKFKLNKGEIPKSPNDLNNLFIELFENYFAEDSSPVQKSFSKQSFKKECKEYLSERINKNYCRYVYLKPSKVNEEKFKNNNSDLKIDFDFKQLNTWNKEKLGKNPWVTITYTQLINTIQKSGAIPKSEQALERYSKSITEKKCIEDIVIANSYINFIQDNIKEQVDIDNFNKNEDYARFDYFKLLFALVKSKISSNDPLSEYFVAGSSNGKMPLFAFYKKVKLPLGEKFDFFEPKREFINIGIQVQGENFKYYLSADENEYDHTEVNSNKKDEYHKFVVEDILIKISDKYNDKFSEGNKYIIVEETYKGFNPNSTKTFYSRSYKIENFIASEKNKIEKPRNIFDIADEISEKVNHFVNFDVLNLISSFKK
jgi:hypothetical protein